MRNVLLLIGGVALGCGERGDATEPEPFDAGFHVEAGGFDAGDPEACTAHPPRSPGIVLGCGETTWLDVADGDALPFVMGPQRGWHFYGSVKHQGIDVSEPVLVAFAAFDGDRQINDGLGAWARPAAWVPTGDGWEAVVGYRVVMNIQGPEEVDGHALCLVARVQDAAGDSHVDERTISLYYDGKM